MELAPHCGTIRSEVCSTVLQTKMRTPVRVDHRRVLELRRARRLTQLDLANRMGVSERTIRNIEKGKPVSRSVSECLATALDVDLNDLSVAYTDGWPGLDLGLSHTDGVVLQKSPDIDHLRSAMQAFAAKIEFDPIMELLHPSVKLRCTSSPATEFDGTFDGPDGIRQFFGAVREFIQTFARPEIQLDRIYGAGDLIVCIGHSRFWKVDETLEEYCWTSICQMRDHRIFRWEIQSCLRAGPQPLP